MGDDMPRRPLSELASLHPDSPNFLKLVGVLSNEYSSWRDVYADGNCLYRTVSRSLLEHFCRPFTDVCEFENFYKRIYYQEVPYASEDEDLKMWFTVLITIQRLIDWKRNNLEGLMEEVDRLLVSDDFMGAFIPLLRHLAHTAFLYFKPADIYYEGIENEADISKMLGVGNLSGHYDYIGLGLALDVDFIEVELGATHFQVVRAKYDGRRDRKGEDWVRRLVIHVGLIDGHHYVFYPKGLETLESIEQKKYRSVEVNGKTVDQYDNTMRAERLEVGIAED